MVKRFVCEFFCFVLAVSSCHTRVMGLDDSAPISGFKCAARSSYDIFLKKPIFDVLKQDKKIITNKKSSTISGLLASYDIAGFSLMLLPLLRNLKGLFSAYTYDRSIAQYPDLTKVQDQYNTDFAGIAKTIGVDPNAILADTNRTTNCGGATYHYARHDLLVLDHNKWNTLSAGQRTFILGHELAHVFFQDHVSALKYGIAIPVVTHFALAACNKAIQEGLNWVSQKFGLKKNRYIEFLKTASNTISQSFVVRCLLNYQLNLSYSRFTEKRADLMAASKLGCAKDGIDDFKQLQDVWANEPFIDRLLMHIMDEHPTYAERISYLTPLAQQQKQLAV